MARRVLFISPYAEQPAYGGAVVRVNALARHLAREHVVWWARRPGPTLPEVDVARIDASAGRWAQILDPALVGRLLRVGHREAIDVVVASTVLSALHGCVVARLLRRPLLFDDHNVEFALMRALRQPAWPLMWLLEGLACRAAARVTCVSELDRVALMRGFALDRARVDVVSNGVDARAVAPSEPSTTALFFGVLDYAPNTEAVRVIDREIAPRLPAVSFVVAGRGTVGPLRSPNVRCIGFVPDLHRLLASAAVVVVPLLHGSGTRIKILEAVAAGRRVVSTAVGASGLDRTVVGEALVVTEGWDAFAAAVEDAIRRGPVAVSPGFLDTFSWDAIFSRCLRLP